MLLFASVVNQVPIIMHMFTVTNIVSADNNLVLDKIRAAGAASLGGAFSRKRSLRKKAKKEQRGPRTPRNHRNL